MFGTVTKGSKTTRFRVECVLDNNCTFYEVWVVYNTQLDARPELYGRTLTNLTQRLEQRIKDRSQLWADR